jgi:Uma2 family endonuclease
MSLAKKINNRITEQDYLSDELLSHTKHEYIDGQVYAMAGASKNHERIAGNIFRGLGNNLQQKKSSCEVFSSDIKVRIADNNIAYFYPDVMVTCDPDDNDSEYYINTPVIIVEVLSKSTRKNDLSTKKLFYLNIPELQEYVVIEQDFCEVEVFRKSDDWKSTVYFLGDEISLESINVTLSVEDIYYHVKNEDMTSFLKESEDIKASD